MLLSRRLYAGQLVAGCNLDGWDKGAINRALFGEHLVHPIDRLLYGFRGGQFQQHVNALDDQRSALIFDFSAGVAL
jgi:hypothetical protein